MSTIKIESKISLNDLLKVVEQLEVNDLEVLVDTVLKLRAKKIAPSLSKKETRLMKIINKPIAKELNDRFLELDQKRKAEVLTKEEYQDLIDITKKFEKLNVDRLKALAELSKIRQIPVRKLMEQLGIKLKAA